ncbi:MULTISPECIES: SDR family NAD(P)-dependent oxidoreductase [Gordonia]|jgi:NAD(P)-dependent dehydrogenase (short-subunit alcohol dehydrogenase family)|uniref:SDR family NAD(P)-dependent oxidoreductase n=1 Tax=Gordonia TaxID=2053 RepID=UPI00096A5624|nr:MULTISPECIES: SDR family NAD(P)-dependent oxidoreductase [Gordonia]MDH3009482.1 SDR family NAD(P)-dependent oxidoreductase [Gordonia alkanivorans]MDH3013936.1 SDR family NAD(P)-dependent oxidoreductase [Gordonia alkanivorans]MDH3018315.1 SDR family NAD(P)-dependent oxidoreductase [Gordonia alkanivorans]MDH3022724.1 SDR family NAD(P)-dependent oxidoreductase [Gordonia alkanivorans]MDH3027153.1 SDR family NAD(P)-dependent oxidoreductase [Gordonia alkanivorans]
MVTVAVKYVPARVAHTALQRPRTPVELVNTLRTRSPAKRLQNLTVLVTGSSSGIGAAAAEEFARRGAHVLTVARRADSLDELVTRIRAEGGYADTCPGDLSDTDDTARLIQYVLDKYGCPDIVVNNAGRSIRREVLDSTDRLHDYQRTMAVNYFGPVQLTLGFLPAMKERGSGHFINVSTWGIPMGAMPKFSAYAGSKAAITAFGRSIASELRGTGVSVTTVFFPLVRTPMIEPTDEYHHTPALTAAEAAAWLVHAAVYRDLEVMPRVARLLRQVGAASSRIADGLVERNAP